MYCRFCGKLVEEDSVYCRYCGKHISSKSKNHGVKEKDPDMESVSAKVFGKEKMEKERKYDKSRFRPEKTVLLSFAFIFPGFYVGGMIGDTLAVMADISALAALVYMIQKTRRKDVQGAEKFLGWASLLLLFSVKGVLYLIWDGVR